MAIYVRDNWPAPIDREPTNLYVDCQFVLVQLTCFEQLVSLRSKVLLVVPLVTSLCIRQVVKGAFCYRPLSLLPLA